MKKSKYVTKYDYLNYYCLQSNFWFFTNAEIQSAIKATQQLCLHNDDSTDDEQQDDLFEDNILDATDVLSSWSETYYENQNNLNDQYSKIYFDYLEKNKDIDENNPLIIEGRKIDELSKEFIKNFYIKKYESINFKVIDFDKEWISLEDCFKKTESLIKNNKNIIIFQPAFINEQKNIVTKCDALVKIKKDIFIIETKGTTTAKLIHFLDLFYQKELLESIEYLSIYDFKYRLCLVDYTIAQKNQIDFVIVSNINLSKSASIPSIETLNKKRKLKQGNKINGFEIDDALRSNFENNAKFLKNEKQNQKVFDVLNNFDKVINELNEHKSKMKNTDIIKDFKPNSKDNSEYKQNSFWPELKKIYVLKGYNAFKYSGNLVDQTAKSPIFINDKNYEFQFKNSIIKNGLDDYLKSYKLFDLIEKDNVANLLNKIKPNKVYFDFETISTATRVIDNSLPFCQIVTQCSIIKTKNNNFKNLKCKNLMIDPRQIENSWFKIIVDNLYSGDDYSYIVYNKSFEKSRLNEMKNYINEEEYSFKIDIIVRNLFDLADFFDLRKKMIYIRKLFGFYSIKKVLPLIKEYKPEIFIETECKDYSHLDISNGLECQHKTTLRFLSDKITDKEWQKIMDDSKRYCENDVRAMIAVELFVKDIFENFETKYSQLKE